MAGRWTFRRGILVGVLLVIVVQYLASQSPMADWLVSPLLLTDSPRNGDVIVVAGAGLIGPCEPNLSAVRRVLKAAELWQNGRAPYVLFTGGRPAGLPCAVADVMADLGAKAGIPKSRILTEATSRNTFENGYYAAPVLQGLGARDVVLVTDRLHMLRASRVLEARGFAVERASVPVYATHHGNIDMLLGAARESAALAYYWARGWFGGDGREAGAAAAVAPLPARASAATAPIVVLGASYAKGWSLAEVAGSPVVNRGEVGQQSFELAERFDRDALGPAPRAVLVWGFINDVFRAPRSEIDTAISRVEQSYAAMIAQARASGTDLILATEVPVTTPGAWLDRLRGAAGKLLRRPGYQDYVNARVRAVNEWLRDTAQREGLLLLDFAHIVSDPDGERRREFAQDDGSHLTEAAYEALTRYATPILERHLGAAAAMARAR